MRYPGRLQGSGRYSICCRWWISCTRLLRCSVKAATFSLGKWFALEAALPLAAWHWHHPRSNAQQYATKLQHCAMTPGSATFSAGNCTTPKHHGTLLWHYYGNIYGNMLWQSLQNLFWTWPLLAGNPTWHAAYLGKTANRTIELENTNISDYEINLVRCASALAEVRLPAFLFKVTLQLYILCTKTGIWYGHVANNVSSTRMHDFSEPELKTFMILCLWSCVSIFCIYLVYLSTYLSIYLPTYLIIYIIHHKAIYYYLSSSIIIYLSISIIIYHYLSSSIIIYHYLSLFIIISLPLSLYLSISLSLSVSLPIYLSIFLSIYLSLYLPLYLPLYLRLYLPLYPPLYLSTSLSFYLSTFLPLYFSTSLPFYLSNFLPFYLCTSLPLSLSLSLCLSLSIYLSTYHYLPTITYHFLPLPTITYH